MRDGRLIRWLPILACMPHLLLAPLSGNTVLLHDHHDHGLHAHILREPEAVSGLMGASFLRQSHRHSHDKPATHDHQNESMIDEATSLLYFVLPVDVASPRRGDLIIKDILIQVYAGMTPPSVIAPTSVWHPPDARAFPPNPRVGDTLAMILRSNNALLI